MRVSVRVKTLTLTLTLTTETPINRAFEPHLWGCEGKKRKKLFFFLWIIPAIPTTPTKPAAPINPANPSYPSSRLYILYNVYLPPFPLILSIKRKNACFPTLFSENICKFHENPLPLHPLLRTNAASDGRQVQDCIKERVLWKDYNKQRSSSTRSRLHFLPYII